MVDWEMGPLDRGEAETKTQIAIWTNLLKMDVFLFFTLTSRAQLCDRIVTCGVRAITRRNLHVVKKVLNCISKRLDHKKIGSLMRKYQR